MKHLGFSLLENLIVITLFCGILLFALFGFNAFQKKQQLRTDQQTLKSWLISVRSRSSRQSVTICPVTKTLSCTTNWSNPLMAFFDQNKDAKKNVGEEALSILPKLKSDLSFRGFPNHSALVFKKFTNSGNGRFTLSAGKHLKTLIISRSGRIRT